MTTTLEHLIDEREASWVRWAGSAEGRSQWSEWCFAHGVAPCDPAAAVGPGHRPVLTDDDAMLSMLIGCARKGEAMAFLALEIEMRRSLLRVATRWQSAGDGSRVTDSFRPHGAPVLATYEWLLGEFALIVLETKTTRSYRSALFGALRRRLDNRRHSVQTVVHHKSTYVGDTVELAQMASSRHQEDAMSSTADALVRLCAVASRRPGDAVELSELAFRVWIADEQPKAVAASLGISPAAARQRLCRLAKVGRQHRALLGAA